MSAAAKTHEPSMEEILASIRRIIADDQENGGPLGPRPMANGVDGGDPNPADDILDLADLKPEPVVTPLDREFAAVDMSFDEPDEGVQSAPAARSEPQPSLSVVEAGRQPASAFDAGNAEPARPAMEPAKPEASPAQAAPVAPTAAIRQSLESLISNEATASVGQAFNVLSNTVLSRNARTLEDLVQDMLKPMLRAWLDDNLPPLVERLVRAEIERVARGSR